ncbi:MULTISPECIES: hypothetical protein [Moorena]|uniref:hypothetical protein n=1 Tax=Moorena TaxID=1155738 RepID=UPI0012B55540|nr:MULTISPECIES: hypothetical protein [Moorena]NEQ17213.1 hypothetical protein [Moorena sp. SIO3E2]NES86719.1 hypothetical protein [Moorena sp. SIO2B7]NEP67419.1 hypothetical protein [Moorena sp. SIO3A5]NEQ07612.1 hypothetical protein [Moorena sp. SIO4E2]NER88972.1 hypothetical protein [Moorena sp. SIO3A2]
MGRNRRWGETEDGEKPEMGSHSIFPSYEVNRIFSRFPIPDSRFPIPVPLLGGVRGGFRLPTPDSLLPIPDSLLPIPYSLFPYHSLNP